MDKIRETSSKPRKDVLSISDTAKDYQVAMKHLKEIPDIRQEKVENSKPVAVGNYNVRERDC